MRPEVEVLRLTFKGDINENEIERRKVSSSVWKNLYILTEMGKSNHDYVLIKKNKQDFFLTFSELLKVGNDEYVLYFMTPYEKARIDIIRAMARGLRIGKKKVKLESVDFIRYDLKKSNYYVTLSPIIVTRNGKYYLPPEIDFFKNLLGYLEIKYQIHSNGKKINLKKDNFKIDPSFTKYVKIDFQKSVIYGTHMGFKLRISANYLEAVSTLIQLGFGTKTGMGYGFIMPKSVVKKEEIEFTVNHPVYWHRQKHNEVVNSIVG